MIMDSNSKTYLENFLSSLPVEDSHRNAKADSYYFCSDEESANHLASLVVQGEKQATASLLWSYEAENEPLPEVGQLSVITNWDGEPQCIVEITEVEIKPYNEVTAEFAFIEGEGDKSLEYWRRVHWEFFSMECEEIGKEPSEEMLVILEKFKVIWKE
jgi:uncharacterized protein YhfF